MKLVRESLNEFDKGVDPLNTLGIGKIEAIRMFFDDLNIPAWKFNITKEQIRFKTDLVLENHTELTGFPELSNMVVEGGLYLKNCSSLISLPDNLIIQENLSLKNCTSLTTLPENLKVGAHLYLANCLKLTELPDSLQVNYKIWISENQYQLRKWIISKQKFKGQVFLDT